MIIALVSDKTALFQSETALTAVAGTIYELAIRTDTHWLNTNEINNPYAAKRKSERGLIDCCEVFIE